jgi:hypothetical protein
MNDEVPGEAIYPMDGKNTGQSVDINVGSPVLEKIHDDLTLGAGDGPEVSEERFAKRTALKRVSAKKIHRDVVELLTAGRGVCERVAYHDVQVREVEIEIPAGELDQSGIDVHADDPNAHKTPCQQMGEGARAQPEEQRGARRLLGKHGGPVPEGRVSVRHGHGENRAVLDQDPVTVIVFDGKLMVRVALRGKTGARDSRVARIALPPPVAPTAKAFSRMVSDSASRL